MTKEEISKREKGRGSAASTRLVFEVWNLEVIWRLGIWILEFGFHDLVLGIWNFPYSDFGTWDSESTSTAPFASGDEGHTCFYFFNSSTRLKMWIGDCTKFAKWAQAADLLYRGGVFFRELTFICDVKKELQVAQLSLILPGSLCPLRLFGEP